MSVRRAQRGQASVEFVALVVVIAALLAGVASWLALRATPSTLPPQVDRLWSELEAPAAPEADRAPDLGLAPRERRRRGLGARFRGAVARAGNIAHDGTTAFAKGFAGATRQAFQDFVDDPVGTLTGAGGLVGALASDPVGFTSAQIHAATAYARGLAAMPADEAYRRFMRDLGSLSADVAIARGKAIASKAVLRALRRSFDGTPPTGLSPPDRLGD